MRGLAHHKVLSAITFLARLYVKADFYLLNICSFKDFIYLFLERGEGERETSMCGCLSRGPYGGPGVQPRHVP